LVLRQILRDAIQRSEHVSIFYRGLKDFARTPDGRMMIDNLTAEENRHIRLLTSALESYQVEIGRIQAGCPCL
jgi:rubrerythrin